MVDSSRISNNISNDFFLDTSPWYAALVTKMHYDNHYHFSIRFYLWSTFPIPAQTHFECKSAWGKMTHI